MHNTESGISRYKLRCFKKCAFWLLNSFSQSTPLSVGLTKHTPFDSHFSEKSPFRVSTNLIKQISRRFPGDSRRDFKKNPGHVCLALASYVMYRCSLPWYRTKVWYAFYTTWGSSKDKIGRPGARFTDNVIRFYHMIYAMTRVMMC